MNCDKIRDNGLTLDKILNSARYGSSFCVIVYTSYKRLKVVQFFMAHHHILNVTMPCVMFSRCAH